MTIIITGASGFVGQNLTAHLENLRWNIVMLSLRSKWLDLATAPAKAIIHLAGKAHDTKNSADPKSYFSINRDLTIKLFDEFLRSGIRDFFFFSSVKAAADTVDGELVETTVCTPNTPYGKSKLEAEEYLLSKTLPAGKRLFIIRPCMIHGPGNKGNLTLLYKVVHKGIPWPLTAFQNRRSFLGIDNLCYLIQQMIDRPEVPSGVYNFADDDSLSTNELVALMSNTLGRKPKFWTFSKGFIQSLSAIGDKLHLPLNSERLKKLTESYVVSNHKIKSVLHINRLPHTVQQGLEKTIQHFGQK